MKLNLHQLIYFTLMIFVIAGSQVWASTDLGNNVEYIPSTRKLGLGKASPSEYLTVNGVVSMVSTSTPSATSGVGKFYTRSTNFYFMKDSGIAINLTNGNTASSDINGLADAVTNGSCVFMGQGSGSSNTGSRNTAIGVDAMKINTSGSDNTAAGYAALYANTTGSRNTAVGYKALYTNSTGTDNTAMGSQALYSNSTGSHNTAVGYKTLYSAMGSYNTAAGVEALANVAPGNANTAAGCQAGYGVAGVSSFNNGTLMGYQAGYSLTSGSNNTLIGYQAGYSLTSGANNTLIGYKAGDNITTGSGNIIIGHDIDAPSVTASNQLNIANLIYGDLSSKRVGIKKSNPGYTLEVNGDAAKPSSSSWTSISDVRLKDVYGTYDSGLKEIMQLNPIRFSYKKNNPRGHSSKEKQVGLIAQDVQKVFPEAISTRDDGYLDLSLHPISIAMINAVKDLEKIQNEEFFELDAEINKIKSELNRIKTP